MRDDFAIFILSHGRPNRVYTLNALDRANYSGDYYIVVDDEDGKIENYKANFGDKVIVFNKEKWLKKTDRGDCFQNRQIVVAARNYCFQLAEELGYNYFMEIDDDYTEFVFRFDSNFDYNPTNKPIEDLDFILEELVKLYERSGAKAVAFAQGGDFIGGEGAGPAQKLKIKRKVMNTILCSPNRPFKFFGSINEDVNAYVRLQQLGEFMFTVNAISINQKATQSNEAGLTDIYLDKGTYVKSFYTILWSPSSVKLREMGSKYRRIHHAVRWRYTVPKIISEDYKK